MSDTKLKTDEVDTSTIWTVQDMRLAIAEIHVLRSENAAMREAIREAHDLIQWLKTNSYGRHLRTASTALAKLQPFLKP